MKIVTRPPAQSSDSDRPRSVAFVPAVERSERPGDTRRPHRPRESPRTRGAPSCRLRGPAGQWARASGGSAHRAVPSVPGSGARAPSGPGRRRLPHDCWSREPSCRLLPCARPAGGCSRASEPAGPAARTVVTAAGSVMRHPAASRSRHGLVTAVPGTARPPRRGSPASSNAAAPGTATGDDVRRRDKPVMARGGNRCPWGAPVLRPVGRRGHPHSERRPPR